MTIHIFDTDHDSNLSKDLRKEMIEYFNDFKFEKNEKVKLIMALEEGKAEEMTFQRDEEEEEKEEKEEEEKFKVENKKANPTK